MGIAVLIIILHNYKRKLLNSAIPSKRVFHKILVCNIIILAIDLAMWLIDGKSGDVFRGIHLTCGVLYYILNPLICYLWLLYVSFKLYPNFRKFKKTVCVYSGPFILSTILATLSPMTKWSFSIDSDNVYHRGVLFIPVILLSAFYILYSFLLIVHKLKTSVSSEDKKICRFMLFFPLVPMIGLILQIAFYGVTMVWNASVISILIIYMNVQNEQLEIDSLTGLYNRRHLERHLRIRTNNDDESSLLFILLIDIDKFKSINDTYGHLAGDEALIQTACLLKHCCKGKYDFVARFAGDEFIIVARRNSKDEITGLIDSIHEKTDEFNKSQLAPYTLSFSIGYSLYNEPVVSNTDDFINLADKRMYAVKTAKANNIRY